MPNYALLYIIITPLSIFQLSCGTSSWKSSGSNTYGRICALTPVVGLQCSVRVDDVIETGVHKNLQCSGKVYKVLVVSKTVFMLHS